MDTAERIALAASLKKGRDGQSMLLPAEAGTFYDKRIKLEITTWGSRGDLTVQEMKLVEQILEHLPRLIRKAEKEWWGYHGDPEYARNVSKPHIWIDREDQLGDKQGQWTFVVGLRDPEAGGQSDYAWHLEFKRTRFLQIWAGS